METVLGFRNQQGNVLRGVMNIVPEATEGVIFLHGFGRSCRELKFMTLEVAMEAERISTFGFDFSGWGHSQGNLLNLSIAGMVDDFHSALQIFASQANVRVSRVVAHSLGACVLAEHLEAGGPSFERMVLIAPALNQRQLLRYWFVRGKSKRLTWQIFHKFVDEDAFMRHCSMHPHPVKEKAIGAGYFLEMAERDYSLAFQSVQNNILHIHGDQDTTVPLESLRTRFKHRLLVHEGDHDLEEQLMVNQWLPQAVRFLAR
ncbi:MAG TPA: alpha/beta fold hydrolase [Candidatus Kapabacteria bacterium]|nr:alpha/beta fold hydrolase [Candidatus Kapabacteria bacterium]